MLYNLEEHLNLQGDLGVTIRFPFNSRSTALMKRIGCKSLPLSRSRSIADRPSEIEPRRMRYKTHQNARRWIAIGHS